MIIYVGRYDHMAVSLLNVNYAPESTFEKCIKMCLSQSMLFENLPKQSRTEANQSPELRGILEQAVWSC